MSARIKLENINKVYDDGLHAIVDFNLEIEDKEFVALVGPSGCGKSTTLRMIAGLENISNGNFIVDNQVMNQMPSKDRDIAMVFQSYALYPHLSVYENMAFGLKLRRMKRSIIDEKVNDAAKILGLENTLNRKPRELSGGQRQRVALGRAIVRKPKIFLMDEPLSNLDAKLRGEMRIALRDIHEKLGTMTIYVTHDQIEAMTMADKIVIINEGFVQQIGKPIELFNDPANLFVAKFIGTPEMNLISGKIENKRFVSKFVSFEIPADKYDFVKTHEGKDIVLGIRPVDIHLWGFVSESFNSVNIKFKPQYVENLGSSQIGVGNLINDDGDVSEYVFQVQIESSYGLSRTENSELIININHSHFFDPATTIALTSKHNDATIKALEIWKSNSAERTKRSDLINFQRVEGSKPSLLLSLFSIKHRIKKCEYNVLVYQNYLNNISDDSRLHGVYERRIVRQNQRKKFLESKFAQNNKLKNNKERG